MPFTQKNVFKIRDRWAVLCNKRQTILKEDGLLSEATSLPTEHSAACPDDSLLNSDDEFPSAQIQWSTDKPKERQEEQLPKLPRKRHRDTPRGSYERPQEKRPCCFQQGNAENIKEKIRKSEESISKLKTHSERRKELAQKLCVTTQGRTFRPMKNSSKTLP